MKKIISTVLIFFYCLNFSMANDQVNYHGILKFKDFQKGTKDLKPLDRYFLAGYLNYQNGLYTQAIRQFDRIINLDPYQSDVWPLLVKSYIANKNYKLAVSAANAALGLLPNFTSIKKQRAVAYFHQKNYKRAIRDFKRDLKSYPNDGNSHYYLGLSYCAQKKFTLCKRHLLVAREYAPFLSLNINQYLANLDFKKNNVLEALDKLEGVHEAYSQSEIIIKGAQSQQIEYASKIRKAKNQREKLARVILDTDIENSRSNIPSVNY